MYVSDYDDGMSRVGLGKTATDDEDEENVPVAVKPVDPNTFQGSNKGALLLADVVLSIEYLKGKFFKQLLFTVFRESLYIQYICQQLPIIFFLFLNIFIPCGNANQCSILIRRIEFQNLTAL